jgi:hypothetical protein
MSFGFGFGFPRRVGAALRAALDFNFLSGLLDPRITFTRASTGTYVNSSGVLTSAAIDTPRFDYDPVTIAPKGLLIEEQRTNSIRNNTMQGAVAGAPGTLPTNWSTSTALTGLTREVVGTGTETGVSYIDIRLSGTPSAAGTYLLLDEANNGVAAITGQAWTHSLFVALAAGSTTGVSSIATVFEERTSANAFVSEQVSTAYTVTTTALGGTRQSKTATTNGGATTAFLNAYFRITLTGAAIDFTIRIGLPQLELGAFATSVIPTTTTAATRAADVASVTGTNFSSWYNQTEGTVFVEPTLTGARTLDVAFFRLDDGTNDNRIQSGTGAAFTLINSFLIFGGVSQGNNVVAVLPTVLGKSAFAFATNSSVTAANGIVGTADTTVTVPTGLNRLLLGRDDTTGYLNGHLRSFKYYASRLNNAQLQSLTYVAAPQPGLAHTLLQIGLTVQTT